MRHTFALALSRFAAVLLALAGLLAAPASAGLGVRQVLIETRVVETTRSDLEKIGVDFSSALATLQATVVRPQAFVAPAGTAQPGQSLVDGWLGAGQRGGVVTILSTPSVTTQPGESARFEIDGPLRDTTGSSPGSFGIDLEVVSKIDVTGGVVLDITARTPTIDVSGPVPKIGSNTRSTTVQLPSGGTVVLGGLLQPDASRLGARVPALGELPVLGRLFRSRSFEDGRSGLVLFITPRIVGEEGSGGGGGGGVTPQSAGDDAPTPAQAPLVYGQADYFGTQSEASRRPDFPLVTSKQLVLVDNPATGHPFLGELSGPNTGILYDDAREDYGFASGFKASVGGWLGRDSDWGVEVGGFYVPSVSSHATLQSGQSNAFFSVPFFNQAINTEYAVVMGSAIAGQPVSTGSVEIGSSLDLWGAGARVRRRGFDCDEVELGFSAGFRYLRLTETFQIDYATNPTLASVPPFFGSPTLEDYLFMGGMVPGVGSRVWAHDGVSAHNDFYGLDLGLDAKVEVIPNLTLTMSPRVAIGANRERLDTSGWGRAVDAAGSAYSTPYGVFARPGAVGSRSETRFAVVPEVDLQFSYQITENFELRFGYDFLFLSDMVWAGNQLGRSINAPIDGFGAFSAQPTGLSRPFETRTYWAQSFRAGINVRF